MLFRRYTRPLFRQSLALLSIVERRTEKCKLLNFFFEVIFSQYIHRRQPLAYLIQVRVLVATLRVRSSSVVTQEEISDNESFSKHITVPLVYRLRLLYILKLSK